MWLLNFLPDWIFHAVVLAGVVGLVASFILGFIPFVKQYKIVIQAAATLLLVLGIFFEGANYNEAVWQQKVAALNVKIAEIEAKSGKETIKVVTKYVTKVQKVEQNGQEIIKFIPQLITEKDNSACTIPNSFVVLHNAAAKNEVPDTTRAANETSSGVNLTDVARTVTINYTTYAALKQQLESLQEWIRSQEKVFNEN